MSRLRVTLSTSPIDREIAQRVESAQRVILEALRMCVDNRDENPVVRRRVLAARRDLERVLGALGSVRRVSALYDVSDTDLSNVPKEPKEPRRKVPEPVVAVPEE